MEQVEAISIDASIVKSSSGLSKDERILVTTKYWNDRMCNLISDNLPEIIKGEKLNVSKILLEGGNFGNRISLSIFTLGGPLGENGVDRSFWENRNEELPFVTLQKKFAEQGIKLACFSDFTKKNNVIIMAYMGYDFREKLTLSHGLNKPLLNKSTVKNKLVNNEENIIYNPQKILDDNNRICNRIRELIAKSEKWILNEKYQNIFNIHDALKSEDRELCLKVVLGGPASKNGINRDFWKKELFPFAKLQHEMECMGIKLRCFTDLSKGRKLILLAYRKDVELDLEDVPLFHGLYTLFKINNEDNNGDNEDNNDNEGNNEDKA